MIKNSQIDFEGKIWKAISMQAKGLIAKLLEKDPNKRISPLEALEHEWLKMEEKGNSDMPGQLI